MNIIEFRLCDEDRSRLDRIATALEGLALQKQTASDNALIEASGVLDQPPLPPAMMDAAFDRFQQKQAQQERIQAAAKAAGFPVEGTAHLEPIVAAPAAPVSEPAPVEPAPAPEVKPVSLGEFQKAIVTRCAESPVMKAKVQALVHRFAASVSTIPEDKRPEVLAELANL